MANKIDLSKIEDSTQALDAIRKYKRGLEIATEKGDQGLIKLFNSEIKKISGMLANNKFDWKQDDLIRNKKALRDFKLVYKAYEGKEFEGTDAELLDAYKSQMRWWENNLPSILELAVKTNDWDDETLKALGSSFDTWDNTDASVGGFMEGVGKMLLDPTTYIGIGTLGAGTVAAQAAKVAAKMGIKTLVKNSAARAAKKAAAGMVYKAPLKGKVAAVAAEGAIHNAGFGEARRDALDPTADTNWGNVAFDATVGGVLGGAIPIAGRGISKAFKGITGSDLAGRYGRDLNYNDQRHNALVEGAISPKGDASKYAKPKGLFQEFALPYGSLGEAGSTILGAATGKGTAKLRNLGYRAAGDMLGGKLGKTMHKAGAMQSLGKDTALIKALSRGAATLIAKPSVALGGFGKGNRLANKAFNAGRSLRDDLGDIVPGNEPLRAAFKSDEAFNKAHKLWTKKIDDTTEVLNNEFRIDPREHSAEIDNLYRGFSAKHPMLSKFGRMGKTVDEHIASERAKTTLPPLQSSDVPISNVTDPIARAVNRADNSNTQRAQEGLDAETVARQESVLPPNARELDVSKMSSKEVDSLAKESSEMMKELNGAEISAIINGTARLIRTTDGKLGVCIPKGG